MATANLNIIEDLKSFLHNATTNAVNRALYTQKPTDFSRKRDLPMDTVIEMIMDFCKRSLSIEIQEFFDTIVQKKAPTESAFCQQRKKLKPLFFQQWNRVLVERFYQHYGTKALLWRGFRLMAADGSSTYLPAKKELMEYFGTRTNQHGQFPMARMVQIQDVLNGIVVWGGIYPIKRSETSIFQENLLQLPEGSLVLLDRYYPSFVLIYLLLHQPTPVHFVMRCKKGFNKEVKAFVCSRKNSKIVKLTPDYKAKAKLKEMGYDLSADDKVKVRLVKFQLSSGETEVLITNLYDKVLYKVEDFKDLYAFRWRIETCYDKEKNKMQIEQYSGYSPNSVEQDYYACLFVLNLQCLIEKQCSDHLEQINARRKYTYKINTNLSLAAMKHYVVKLFISKDPQSILEHLQKAFERNVVPVRPGRHYKHKRKARRVKGKYQTFTNYKRAI